MTGKTSFCLASASPRRRELLAQVGLHPLILGCEVDESVREGEQAEDYVRRMAAEKAQAGRDKLRASNDLQPVLAGDTAVIAKNQVLGKPIDKQDAFRMLTLLSGSEHLVLSAVALADENGVSEAMNRTRVQFRTIEEHEMDAYWQTDEPRDKAGAYAIQGLGAAFVSSICGSYSAVVGLPLFETLQLLANQGIDVPWGSRQPAISGAIF